MELLGAIKIKDGLFIGDEYAAQDLEFIVANKVTRVVNCAAKQIPNHWESIGINYHSYYWYDSDTQRLFTNESPLAIQKFIDESSAHGESVLVHSVKGQSRAVCVVAVYFMRKYGWALDKTLEFLRYRRPDMNIKPAFLQQLVSAESSLRTLDVDETEEMVINNTFVNARMHLTHSFEPPPEIEYRSRLTWADNSTGKVEELVDIGHTNAKNPVLDGFAIVKSCVKGAEGIQNRLPVNIHLGGERKLKNSNIGNAVLHVNQDEMTRLADELAVKKVPKKEDTVKLSRPKSRTKRLPKNSVSFKKGKVR